MASKVFFLLPTCFVPIKNGLRQKLLPVLPLNYFKIISLKLSFNLAGFSDMLYCLTTIIFSLKIFIINGAAPTSARLGV